MKREFSLQICEKYPIIKFPENPSYGGRDVPCGLTDGRADTTKLTVHPSIHLWRYSPFLA